MAARTAAIRALIAWLGKAALGLILAAEVGLIFAGWLTGH